MQLNVKRNLIAGQWHVLKIMIGNIQIRWWNDLSRIIVFVFITLSSINDCIKYECSTFPNQR